MDRHGYISRIAYKFYAIVRIYDPDTRKYEDVPAEYVSRRDNWSTAHTALYRQFKDRVVSSVMLTKKENILYYLEDETFYAIAKKHLEESNTY